MEKEARHPSKKAGGTSTDSGGPTALALRLSNKISDCEEHEGQNIMFSPLSIYTALGLLAAGARGDTLDEILAVLGAASRDEVAGIVRAVSERALVADNPSGPLVVTSACSLWCQKDLPLKPAYKKAAVESYKANARAVDFVRKPDDAREEINRWVTEATKKLITSVVPPGSVHGDTRLVLANAIYFKGKWEVPFLKSRTKDKLFHRLDGSDVRVPFMTGGKAGDYLVACHDRFKVLKLPYMQATNKSSGARYSMCIFLPTARDGLRSLADEMASGGPGFLFDHLPTWSSSLTKLRLPKFKLSFFCSMKKALESLGLRAAFGEEADLSDMVQEDSGGDDVPLRVEDVFHRAVVEVNEEGTEAAAFIDMGMVLRCGKVPVDDFIANHPFAFFIVEEVSRTVVFAGHVLDPSKTTE